MTKIQEKIIEIPSEYKRLFDNDWREAAVYGGRYCFDGDTIISMYDGSFKRISDIMVGEKVLSLGGEYDIISSVDSFKANIDPKPMFELEINGTITKTTYDHKYFNGETYVPIYQLVWGIMDTSQRRTLQLLCKQYGKDTHNELQGWLQNQSNEAINKSERLSNDGSRGEDTNNTQDNSENIYSKSREQRNSKSQERGKDGQQDRKFGVDDTQGTITSLVGKRIEDRPENTGEQFSQDNRGGSKRIIAISLRQPDNANTNDGRVIERQNWVELRWDTGFTEWKDLEVSTSRLPSQETNSVGGKEGRIRVKKVSESVNVWSISTEKYHNYFANGVNVSNSLKSHTVARVLLIRARMNKIRVACFREFQNSIADSSHQLLADLITKYELNDYKVTDKSIINTVTGSDFLFKGLHHNEQNIKSTEGIDIAWVEEAQTVSKQSLEILTPTIRKPNSQIIYTYNRLLEDDPVHTRLVIEGRPDTLIINCNYDIAIKYGMMPENILKEIEDDKKNRPALYKHKWLGEPNSLERKIYKDWRFIEEIPHEARLERFGIDFGYSNDPTAIIAIYYYNGGYILDEICYQKGLSNKQIADILLNQERVLCIADSAEPKSIDEIKSYGVLIKGAEKGKDSINNGINSVQEQKISVTKRSINIIKEFNNYLWEEDKDGKIINKPIDIFNHAMDAIRYGISSLAPVKRRIEKRRQLGIDYYNNQKRNKTNRAL